MLHQKVKSKKKKKKQKRKEKEDSNWKRLSALRACIVVVYCFESFWCESLAKKWIQIARMVYMQAAEDAALIHWFQFNVCSCLSNFRATKKQNKQKNNRKRPDVDRRRRRQHANWFKRARVGSEKVVQTVQSTEKDGENNAKTWKWKNENQAKIIVSAKGIGLWRTALFWHVKSDTAGEYIGRVNKSLSEKRRTRRTRVVMIDYRGRWNRTNNNVKGECALWMHRCFLTTFFSSVFSRALASAWPLCESVEHWRE